MSMDKCKVCGGDLNLSDSFCPQCGFEHHILPEPVSEEVKRYEEKRIKAYKKAWEEHKQGYENLKKNYEAEVSKNKTLEQSFKEEKAKTRAAEQEKERLKGQVDKVQKELDSCPSPTFSRGACVHPSSVPAADGPARAQPQGLQDGVGI